jgi:putative hydrolase of the HAD superfamily
VPPVLQQLRSRGLQLGIASNFDARLLTVAAGHWPLAMPDATFISSQIGYSKPDPRFFRAVEARLSAPPHQIALIGDDWLNDVIGARSAGWHAIHVVRRPSGSARGEIASLAEALQFLGQEDRRSVGGHAAT